MRRWIIVPLQKIISNRRVARGARYNDVLMDKLWFKFVNTALLDMTDRSNSIIGQWIANAPVKNVKKIKIKKRISRLLHPQSYGFVVDRWSPAEILNRAWAKEIEKRRACDLAKQQKILEAKTPRPVGKF